MTRWLVALLVSVALCCGNGCQPSPNCKNGGTPCAADQFCVTNSFLFVTITCQSNCGGDDSACPSRESCQNVGGGSQVRWACVRDAEPPDLTPSTVDATTTEARDASISQACDHGGCSSTDLAVDASWDAVTDVGLSD